VAGGDDRSLQYDGERGHTDRAADSHQDVELGRGVGELMTFQRREGGDEGRHEREANARAAPRG